MARPSSPVTRHLGRSFTLVLQNGGVWRGYALTRPPRQQPTAHFLCENTKLSELLASPALAGAARRLAIGSDRIVGLLARKSLPEGVSSAEGKEIIRWEAPSLLEEHSFLLPPGFEQDPSQLDLAISTPAPGWLAVAFCRVEEITSWHAESAAAGFDPVAFFPHSLLPAACGYHNATSEKQDPTRGCLFRSGAALGLWIGSPQTPKVWDLYPFPEGAKSLPPQARAVIERNPVDHAWWAGDFADSLRETLPALWQKAPGQLPHEWEAVAIGAVFSSPGGLSLLPMIHNLPEPTPWWKRPAAVIGTATLMAIGSLIAHTARGMDRLAQEKESLAGAESRLARATANYTEREQEEASLNQLEAALDAAREEISLRKKAAVGGDGPRPQSNPAYAATALRALAGAFEADPRLERFLIAENGQLEFGGRATEDAPVHTALLRFLSGMGGLPVAPVHLTTAPDPANPALLVFHTERFAANFQPPPPPAESGQAHADPKIDEALTDAESEDDEYAPTPTP